MTEILLRNYKIKNSIAIGFVLLVLLSSIVNSYTTYVYSKENFYHNIDTKLKVAASNIGLVLKDDFFDRAIKEDSISKGEDLNNTLKLSKYVKNLDNIEYVYSMVQKDGDIYFINSSAKDDEIGTEDMTLYFDKYDEATDLLKNILKDNKIKYEESTDKWGTFRTVFIPMETKDGHKYILGADVKIDFIQKRLDQLILNIVYTQAFILIVLMILGFYFINISKKEFAHIQRIKRDLDAEIEEKTEELAQLNNSLEIKVKEEIEKNHKKDQQLLQQSRLAQMGEMLAMIAHQWRQPLSAISSAGSAIRLKAQLNKLTNDVGIELSTNIINYTKHLSTTIDDFRDFFKPNKEKKDTTYKEMLDSVINIVELSLVNKNIKLVKTIDSDVVFHTYPNEVNQVILNLIKNAEDILLENKIENPTIKIEAKDEVLTILDNGGGVPKDIIGKVFDPYFSTKLEKNGSGLGLYMSKTIIEEHCGGELTVKNSQDGAVFSIRLRKKS